jgi:transposase
LARAEAWDSPDFVDTQSTEEPMRVRRPKKNYDADFKAEAIALADKGDRSLQLVAADLGISYWTLRHWRDKDMAKRRARTGKLDPGNGNESLEERLARLERENARLLKENEQLKEDREILKKAAAFFAKESE